MAYNLEPRTIKENLLGLIGKNPHAEPRPANTREECFLADIAENGGGGGGLPPYTSADKGKVLTVGEGSESETVTIVPEQTVTADGTTPTMLSNVNTDYLDNAVVGDVAVLTVNGTEETATYTDMGSAYIFLATTYGVLYQSGQAALFSAAGTPVSAGDYTVSLTASVPSVEPKWEGLIPPFSVSDDEKSLTVSVTKEIVTVMPDQTVTITGGAAEVTGVTATRENHTDSCTLMIGAVPINLPDWIDAPQGYGFRNQDAGYALIYNSSAEEWMLMTSGFSDGSYVVAAFDEQVTDISTVWRRIIPDYKLASEGDVLTIENGVPVWKQSSPK